MKANAEYDSEYDILYIYPKDKETSVDFSIDYDNIVLDVSGNKIVGIEIIDASDKFIDDNSIEKMKKFCLQ